MAEKNNYFIELNKIDVSDKTETKDTGKVKLTYLSWAWAWGELKKLHPDATYTVYENAAGLFYHTDGKTCWVKTGVTVNGIEHIEYLPVMNYRNQSILLKDVTSMDVNKAIQRSLTKAVARHGLGLYIYAGEDLPEDAEQTSEPKKSTVKKETREEIIDDAKKRAEDTAERNASIDHLLGLLNDTHNSLRWVLGGFEKNGRKCNSLHDLTDREIEFAIRNLEKMLDSGA